MKETTTKKDINNSCTNGLDLQLISQIKNGVFYCQQFNKMTRADECKKCKYYPKGVM